MEAKKKSLKTRKDRVVFLLYTALLVCILLIFLNMWNVLEEKRLPVVFYVEDTLGFDLNTSALTFGKLPQQSSATRKVLIENDFEKGVFVRITASNNLQDFLRISDNNFYLSPGKGRLLEFSVFTDRETKEGKYHGEVYIQILRYWGENEN